MDLTQLWPARPQGIFYESVADHKTYEDLWTEIRRAGDQLAAIDETYVAVTTSDPYRFFAVVIAAFYSQHIIVGFSKSLQMAEVEALAAAHDRDFHWFDLESEPDSSSVGSEAACQDLQMTAPCLVLLTSGSSGASKGVLHTPQSLIGAAQSANDYFALQPSHSWLLSLGAERIGGLMILLRSFLAGATVVQGTGSKRIAEDLRCFRPSHLSVVPTQLRDLLANEAAIGLLQNLNLLLVGGAGIDSRSWQRCRALGLAIALSYGSTETAAVVCATRPENPPLDCESVGYPLPGRKLRLNRDGRAQLGGALLFCGYLRASGPGRAASGMVHN